MPRQSKPWYWSSRKRWATTIDGRRVVAPPEVETEHQAWEWHASVLEREKPVVASVATLTVWDVFEAFAAADAALVDAGTRDKRTAQVALGRLQRAAQTPIARVKFGSHRVSRLSMTHYDALIAAWRRDGLRPNYIASLASSVKAVLAWASRASVDRPPLIETSPFDGCRIPPVPNTGEKMGDRTTAAAWLRYLWRLPRERGRSDALFQRLLIHTGARPSEWAWATWGDVSWDASVGSDGRKMAIVARREWKNSRKTGRVRRIFVPTRLVRALKRRAVGKAPGDLIFPRASGTRHTSASLAARTTRHRIAAQAAGVPLTDSNGRPITNYLWRHTAASTLLMNGVDAATTAELLGTSVVEIQRTYGHLLADHLADASGKLGRRR